MLPSSHAAAADAFSLSTGRHLDLVKPTPTSCTVPPKQGKQFLSSRRVEVWDAHSFDAIGTVITGRPKFSICLAFFMPSSPFAM